MIAPLLERRQNMNWWLIAIFLSPIIVYLGAIFLKALWHQFKQDFFGKDDIID